MPQPFRLPKAATSPDDSVRICSILTRTQVLDNMSSLRIMIHDLGSIARYCVPALNLRVVETPNDKLVGAVRSLSGACRIAMAGRLKSSRVTSLTAIALRISWREVPQSTIWRLSRELDGEVPHRTQMKARRVVGGQDRLVDQAIVLCFTGR